MFSQQTQQGRHPRPVQDKEREAHAHSLQDHPHPQAPGEAGGPRDPRGPRGGARARGDRSRSRGT